MDNQNQQPIVQPEQPNPNAQPVATSQPSASKPPLEISDAAAQALLALNGVESRPKTKLKLPIGMLVAISLVIALVIAASYLLSGAKPSKSQASNTGSSSQNSDNQVNQDVKSCSNVVNAVSEC